MTDLGLIASGEETAYRGEVAGLVAWWQENNLFLNTENTKTIIGRKEHNAPIKISGREG